MKRLLLLLLLVPFGLTSKAQLRISPSIKTKTTFAIVVDQETYNKTKEAIMSYREVIEADQLGTYILVDNWSSPQEIKNKLMELYREKQPLEGAVFIGDIPIAMLRDAQHLTTAFKMNQSMDWKRSSVPSDRFYDDFDLEFDFIKQDEEIPAYFYYALRPDSHQQLNSEIYTARIRPLQKGEIDTYTQINNYLAKVVKERKLNPSNKLDQLTMARGYGYNSESIVSWADEQLALNHQLPTLFMPGSRAKFFDFEAQWPTKRAILNEITYPDLDVMLLHHHGSITKQFINGYKRGSDVPTSISNIQYSLRNRLAKAKDKKEAIMKHKDEWGVSQEWIDIALDSISHSKADSILEAGLEIRLDDIQSITPNARFIMLDACYNGSFHADNYVAGNYLFNKGKTIAVQGNTVNVLQDKWPNRYFGILGMGVRLGQWHKMVNYLETHLLGDPTYRFQNSKENDNLSSLLTIETHNIDFWLKQLQSNQADWQGVALRMLTNNQYNKLNNLLVDTYKNSPHPSVRLEALTLLGRVPSEELIEVLKMATNDSYELIRRFAILYIGELGDDSLLSNYVQCMVRESTSRRINFKFNMTLRNLNLPKLKKELIAEKNKYSLYDETYIDDYIQAIDRSITADEKSFTQITNKEEPLKSRKLELRRYRNNPATKDAHQLIDFIFDDSQELELRTIATEALGWFIRSSERFNIVDRLSKQLAKETNETLKNEIQRTINRLR